MNETRIDALLPAEIAERAEAIGVRKASMPVFTMFMLAVLAGAFISLGAIFSTTVASGGLSVTGADGMTQFTVSLPYGLTRLLTGLSFCLGLILVVLAGAELFTGNNLIVMAWASGKVTASALLRNWVIVYIGNFVGALGTAAMMYVTRQYTFGGNSVGVSALKIAVGKVELEFWQAVALGVLCNALVCLAVWLTYGAHTTVDKILAIIFPITAFVAAGFEHSVANMYFVSYALFVHGFDPTFTSSVADKVPHLENLTWQAFIFKNLLPVTLGNIIGGSLLVAVVYWSIFLRSKGK